MQLLWAFLTHGMNDDALREVYRALVLGKLLYVVHSDSDKIFWFDSALSFTMLSNVNSTPSSWDSHPHNFTKMSAVASVIITEQSTVMLNNVHSSIAGLQRSDRITDTLANLHWLCSSERIQYKLATMVFQSLHGLALPYLYDSLYRLVDIPLQRRLWFASSL